MAKHHPDYSSIEHSPLTNGRSNEQQPLVDHQHQRGIADEETAAGIAHRENTTISFLRLIVLGVLAASTALVGFAVYSSIRRAERDRFEESFLMSSSSLFDSVGNTLYTTLGAVDTFVVSMVSFARYTNMEWPFVTLPDFGVQVAKLRARANVAVVNQVNLVKAGQREQWEKYAMEHDDWVREGIEVQKNDINYRGTTTIPSDELSSSTIVGADGPVKGPGPFLPTWQEAPVMGGGGHSVYNYDFPSIYSDPEYVEETLGNQRVVIAECYNLPDPSKPGDAGPEDEVSIAMQEFIKSLDSDRDPSEPLSDILYPIVSNAADSVSYGTNGTSVGLLVTTVFWSDLIKNVLPTGTNGVIFVFENPCSQTFTYRIDGAEATYLGPGDHHDSKYDFLEQKVSFQELAFPSSSRSIYTGLPLSEKGCSFNLHMYPSEEYEASFITNDPVVYGLTVLAIFGMMSCLFLAYDICVERRQQIVMKTVMESSANVLLLEEKVQERTRKIQETNTRLEEANRSITAASARQLQHFAMMSHELRTPMHCIVGLSSLLLDTQLNPMQDECMRMIVSSSDLLLAVANDVLDYGKLEAGHVDTEVGRTNLQEVLNSVVRAIETKAKDHNVLIRTRFGMNIGAFTNTDSRRLKQILYNLLGNAIKFSRAESHVELAVELIEGSASSSLNKSANFYSPCEDAETEVVTVSESHPEGALLRFSVKNYGDGIPKADMRKIFKPFRQADSATEHVYGGTGLGLAITQKLVNALGGRISVESALGEWALFAVEFPASTMEPVDVDSLSAELKTTRISLISDDSQMVDQVCAEFISFGVDYCSFGNMEDLEHDIVTASKNGSSPLGEHLICLVHEDLFDQSVWTSLAKFAESRFGTTLVTFGPNHSVPDGRGHLRSLVRLLPSVLMQRLASYVDSGGHAATHKNREASTARTTGRSTSDVDSIPYQNFRVLVAEDNLINQKVLLRMLNRLGVQNVDVVDNGKEAVDAEALKSYQLVLMDMQMPVMNGTEACRQISCRRAGTHPKPRVFFVTAHASKEFEDECFESGASGFLSKPCSLQDLEKCFQQVHTLMEADLSMRRNDLNGYGHSTIPNHKESGHDPSR